MTDDIDEGALEDAILRKYSVLDANGNAAWPKLSTREPTGNPYRPVIRDTITRGPAVPLISVQIEDIRPTIVGVQAMMAAHEIQALHGALKVARDIQAKARRNMGQHRYDGRAQAATTVWTGVNPVGGVRVHVGIRGNTFAPEGKTFEVGWHSQRGLQPPVEALVEWVRRKHIIKGGNSSAIKSMAFVVARSIGKRPGYKFGEFHWLSDAANDAMLTAGATIQRYMNSSWAATPRGTGGKFISASSVVSAL